MKGYQVQIDLLVEARDVQSLARRLTLETPADLLRKGARVASIQIVNEGKKRKLPPNKLAIAIGVLVALIAFRITPAAFHSASLATGFAYAPVAPPTGLTSFVHREKQYGVCYDPQIFVLTPRGAGGDFSVRSRDGRATAEVTTGTIQNSEGFLFLDIDRQIAELKTANPKAVITARSAGGSYDSLAAVSPTLDYSLTAIQNGRATTVLRMAYPQAQAKTYDPIARYMASCFIGNSVHQVAVSGNPQSTNGGKPPAP